MADSPQDGFDLIEYPCDYSFKAMCRVDATSPAGSDIKEAVKNLVIDHVAAVDLLEIRSQTSRTGKFESVTVSVHIYDRAELESVYQALAASEMVVMTL